MITFPVFKATAAWRFLRESLNDSLQTAPRVLGAAFMAFGLSKAVAATAFIADYTTFTVGGLAGQNSWAQVTSSTNTATPIQVIAAATTIPQSIKIKGVASAAQAYRDLPVAFNPVGATATSTFYYVIENLRVIQAYNSSTGTGSGICALTTTAGGTGTFLSRLYVRRFGGVSSNTLTYDLGLNPAGAGIVYGTTPLSLNTSYRIVVEYTANPTGTLDVVKVYVNPAGLNPAAWTAEISQTIATDPTASAKAFVWTPGAVSQSTINEFTVSKLLVGDTPADVLPPGAPVVAAATNVASGGFTANWSASTGATGYYLDVSTDATFATLVSGYSNLDVGDVTSWVVTGTFDPGQTLYYRVRARSTVSSSDSSAVQNIQLPGVATALVYTNGSTTGAADWVTIADWDTIPVSDAKSTVNFIGALSGGLSVNNAAAYTLNALNFANSGTGPLAVTGGLLTFETNTAPATPVAPAVGFSTAAAVSVTVSNPMALNSDTTFSRASTAGTVSIDGVIGGNGAFIKAGNGNILISGVSNTFSGGVKINDNELRVNTLGGSLGTGNITLGKGTTTGLLRWGDSFTATTESTSKTITLAGTSGGGTIDVRGANELTLNGAIDTGSDASNRALQFTGNGLNATSGYSLVVNGLISGNARLRINGSGDRSVVLANSNNTFTGGVTLDGNTTGKSYKTYVTRIGNTGEPSPLGTAATINFGSNNTGGAFNFLVWTSSVNETTDKVINLAGTTNGALVNNKGSALLKFTSALTATGSGIKTLYADQDFASGSTEFSGSIPDSAGGATLLNKNGLGTLILSAANTFTGGTTIKGGTLQLGHASALASSGNVAFTSNGVGTGAIKLAYSGSGPTLGNLLVQRNATIDLGATAGASITFATAAGWTAGTTLTVANSATASLYILNATGLDLAQIVSFEMPFIAATHDPVTGQIRFGQADTTAPVISLGGASTIGADWGSLYTDAGATASDNVDGSVNVITTGSVNTARPGVYILTYNASDAAGNAATAVTRTVTVTIANATTADASGYSPLMRYAFGANGPSDSIQAPVTSSTAAVLSITAVVRTNDSGLTVTGEAVTDLVAGTWGTGGTVTVTTAADQTNLPANCVRRVFSVDTTGAAKKFLRLKVVGSF